MSTWETQSRTVYPGWIYSGGPFRLFGMGGSFNAATTSAGAMRLAGLDVTVHLASEHRRADLSLWGSAETQVLVSASGESAEMIELAEHLQQRGFTRTVAMVNSAAAPLARLCRHVIELGIVDEQPIDTFIATVMALRRLDHAVRGVPVPDISADAGAIERASQSAAGLDWGKPPSHVDLLGQRSLNGVAAQGALLFREIARIPAASWDSSNFKHGPIESIHPDQLTVLLASDDAESRDIDEALALDISSIPGRSLVVGSAATDDCLTCDSVDFLTGTPQLAALIPGIYAWGKINKVPPGELRYTQATMTRNR